MKGMITFQLGKNGATESFISSLEKSFKTRELVKITVLRAFSRNREKISETAEFLSSRLGENFTYKVIGFTIAIRKWRKARQK